MSGRICKVCRADISERYHNAIYCKACADEKAKRRHRLITRRYDQRPEIKARRVERRRRLRENARKDQRGALRAG